MDFVKAQLDRIQQQLAGLNATQKMLTGALVAIMVITVIWWGKYAGEAEMVPLLDKLSAADVGRIQARLEQKQVRFAVSGDTITVPADQRMALLADLTYSRLLPRDTQGGIDDILKQMNPFDSQSKDDQLWNQHKQAFLSQIIGQIQGVMQAAVIIDSSSARRIEGDIQPKATVNLVIEPGLKDTQRFVDAAAALVVGSQAGLDYSHITVVVNGMRQHVGDPVNDGLGGGSEQLTLKEKYEQDAEAHIRREYPFIPDMSVAVTVKLNATDIQMEKQGYDPKNKVQSETKITEQTDDTTGGAGAPSGEAGTVPNTGLSLANSGAAGGPSQHHSQTDTQFQNYVGSTHTISKTPAGSAIVVSAALYVPHSYFVNEYKSLKGTSKDPTEQELAPMMTSELAGMRQSVANLMQLPSIDKVTVGTWADSAPATGLQFAMASKPSTVSAMVGGHAKEIALGTLALMSLFMASMMVRKSIPSPVPAMPTATAQQPAMPAILMAGEQLAGEAGSGNAMLDGMELNEDAIKAQQMVDQVSTMVRENPDAAASLVRRWLNRT